MLKKGSKGKAVVDWQQWLNRYGFRAGAADGKFGNRTEAAVKRFQKKARIKVDGQIGPICINARKHWRTLPVRIVRKVSDRIRRWIPKKRWAYIGVHHSVTRGGDAALIYGLHRARGWNKGGYHEVILPDGSYQTGDQYPQYLRRSNEIGAHIKRHNYHAYGICILTMDKPNAAQLKTLKARISFLRSKGFGKAKGHREFSGTSTSCPGNWDLSIIHKL